MKFTAEMNGFIVANAEGISNLELTELFNKEFGTNVLVKQIKAYKKNHKISSGLTGHFPKGHIPCNKGKKGTYYAGSEKTWFKNGQMPHNHKPVGSERVSKDGYIEIKVAEPKKWRLKHNVVWENVRGKVPRNHVVIFLDRNKLNVDIGNLKLISRGQLLLMNRNGFFTGDRNLTETAANLAKLMDTKYKAKKKGQSQE
ncbi:MAG: HNH endonuclease signature motif containing protein [Anaerotignum sp.]|nr:HNH endonuclease signature motif containing protein [Anaerotignum sp.]